MAANIVVTPIFLTPFGILISQAAVWLVPGFRVMSISSVSISSGVSSSSVRRRVARPLVDSKPVLATLALITSRSPSMANSGAKDSTLTALDTTICCSAVPLRRSLVWASMAMRKVERPSRVVNVTLALPEEGISSCGMNASVWEKSSRT